MKIVNPVKSYLKDKPNEYGNYIFSKNFCWHGGIHIEGAERKIQAIAKGRIIAYRFMDDYKKTLNPSDSKKTFKYSNCFVLIQHDLKLSKDKYENKGKKNQKIVGVDVEYVTFYSLYSNLLPIKPVDDNDKLMISPHFGKTITSINSVNNPERKKEIKGLRGREFNGKKRGVKTTFIIPFGTQVEVVLDEKLKKPIYKYHDIKKSKNKLQYVEVKYNDKNFYICTSNSYVKKVVVGGKHKYEIVTYTEDTEEIDEKYKGARVFHKKDKKGVVLDFIPLNHAITKKEKQGKWYIIDGYTGFVHENDIVEKIVFDENKDQVTKDEIVHCNIPVKAEDHIGYTALQQHAKTNGDKYYACQFEVFMDKADVDRFLSNGFGVGENLKKYSLIPKGNKLYKTLEEPVSDLKKKTPVKIVKRKGNYFKVNVLQELERIINKSAVYTKNYTQYPGAWHPGAWDPKEIKEKYSKEKGYSILDFEYLNKEFDNMLTSKSKIFDRDKEGNKKKNKRQDKLEKTFLRVYSPFDSNYVGQEFWVKITDVSDCFNFEKSFFYDKAYQTIRKNRSLTAFFSSIENQTQKKPYNNIILKNRLGLGLGLDYNNVEETKYKEETTEEITRYVLYKYLHRKHKEIRARFRNYTKTYYLIKQNDIYFKEINKYFDDKLDSKKDSKLFFNGKCDKKGHKGTSHRKVIFVYTKFKEKEIKPELEVFSNNNINAKIPMCINDKFEGTIKISSNYDSRVVRAFFGNKLPKTDLTLKTGKYYNDKGKVTKYKKNAKSVIFKYNQKDYEKEQDELHKTHYKKELEKSKPKVGDDIILVRDVDEIYRAVPENDKEYDFTFEKETIVKIISDYDKPLKWKDDEYVKVETYDLIHANQKINHKGWINKKILKKEELFSPYKWNVGEERKKPQDNGFLFKKIIADSNEFFFEVEGNLDLTKTKSKFIKDIWETLGFINDDEIDNNELEFANGILEARQDLSKLVVIHKNEWSYTSSEIKDELDKFYNPQINKLNKKQNIDEEKLNKEKQDFIDAIGKQVDNLNFWDDVSSKIANSKFNKEDGQETPPVNNEQNAQVGSTTTEEVSNNKGKQNTEKGQTTQANMNFWDEVSSKINGLPPYNNEEKEEPTVVNNEKNTQVGSTTTEEVSNNKGEQNTEKGQTTPAEQPKATVKSKDKKPTTPKIKFPQTNEVAHFHPFAFVEQMKLIYGNTEYCLNEMKVRALLRLIKKVIGTSDGLNGYDQTSGAYQLGKVWDNFKKQRENFGLKDFSPLAQDYTILFYLKNIEKPTKSNVKIWGEQWADRMIKKWKATYDKIDKIKKSPPPPLVRKSFFRYVDRFNRSYGDVIQHLIDNDFDRVLLTLRQFQNFPDSIKQKIESLRYSVLKAKVEYREFLLEEISGITDLHLEEGFLRELGYNPTSTLKLAKGVSPEGKKPIDLRPTMVWHSQFIADTHGRRGKLEGEKPHSQGNSCFRASESFLQKICKVTKGGARGNKSVVVEGVRLDGVSNNGIQMALEVQKDKTYNVIEANFEKGIDYLDQELEKGNPILIGVSHEFKGLTGRIKEENYDKSTDHFVTIVGRGYDNDKRYFLFYEVGTYVENFKNGQHELNRLYVNNDKTISGIPQHKKTKKYTLTHIRGNKINGNFK